MNIELITSLIGNLGFPIACCIGLFWMLAKTSKEHKEEMEKMSEALNNNTLAIKELSSRFEREV